MNRIEEARAAIAGWEDRPSITRHSHRDQVDKIEQLVGVIRVLIAPPTDESDIDAEIADRIVFEAAVNNRAREIVQIRELARAASAHSPITEETARAVTAVDAIAQSTGMSRGDVISTINAIRRTITDQMVVAAAWAILDRNMDTADRSPSKDVYDDAVADARAALEAAESAR